MAAVLMPAQSTILLFIIIPLRIAPTNMPEHIIIAALHRTEQTEPAIFRQNQCF